MEDRAEVIRQHMQEKRAELSEKLQTLERQVTQDITEAEEKVTETVENVTENVQQTVDSVRQALDISRHVQEHPWLAVGGAVVVGYLAYGFLRRGGLNLSAGLAGAAEGGVIGEQLQNLERFAARTVLELVGSALKDSMPGQLGETAGEMVHSLAENLTAAPGSAGSPAANQNGGPR